MFTGFDGLVSVFAGNGRTCKKDIRIRYVTFADDMVLMGENTKVLEGKLVRCTEVLEKIELIRSTIKREFLEFTYEETGAIVM